MTLMEKRRQNSPIDDLRGVRALRFDESKRREDKKPAIIAGTIVHGHGFNDSEKEEKTEKWAHNMCRHRNTWGFCDS